MSFALIALFWGLAAWGIGSRQPVLLYLYFASMPFGAFAVVPTALTGGLTFTATPMIALMLVARAFARRDGPAVALGLALRPNRLLLLFLYGCVAIIVTVFMPRLFAGSVQVIAVRGGNLDQVVALRPTMQNISQLAYLLISIMSVFAFARILQSSWVRQQALQALCLGGAVTALTGFADFASQFLPLSSLLEPFRTATYALAIDVEVLGGKRVVGLMPEASAYGGLCLAFLCAIYFLRPAIASHRLRETYAPMVLITLLACAWIAKSSGTYVGLGLFFVIAALEWFLRINARSRPDQRGIVGELALVVGLVIAVSLVLIVRPDTLSPVYDIIDRMVLQKGASDSFNQRGMWRAVAAASLIDTHGLGVGLGAARTSSSMVAVFSSTGLLGGMLYYAFVIQSLARGTRALTQEARLLLSGFRFSFFPGFVVALMVGDADFGGMLAFGFGLVAALSHSAASPRNPNLQRMLQQSVQ
ncbi:hypothetical protein MTR62_14605 [Novosphingobium sp. 1949]|uniref:Uncharacterized protein n=1 Tax=Novosphingobium organovorum TaxID=2930092 RepID=A0ABT0BGH6_9SPHN|nr:hypothetical protein [Novosphingobium organovorum]MCJ2183916.1 hypothetical protein [Novosphingobium organovorum]